MLQFFFFKSKFKHAFILPNITDCSKLLEEASKPLLLDFEFFFFLIYFEGFKRFFQLTYFLKKYFFNKVDSICLFFFASQLYGIQG